MIDDPDDLDLLALVKTYYHRGWWVGFGCGVFAFLVGTIGGAFIR